MATVLDKPLPKAEAAEKAVLGCCLLDAEACEFALADLVEDDFAVGAHRAIWRAITSLAEAGRAVDMVSVMDALLAAGAYDSVGGTRALTDLIDTVPTTANIDEYIRQVRAASYRRSVILGSMRLIEAAHDAGTTPAELAAMPNPLEARSSAATEDVPLSRVMADILEDLEHERREEYLPTGLPELDAQMDGGLYLGDLTILAARPSMGKTSLASAIAQHVAEEGHPVLYVNLEMRNRYLGYRWAAARVGLPLQVVRRYEAVEAVARAVAELGNLPIRLSNAATTRGIAAVARDARLIVVDFLTLLHMPGRRDESLVLRIGRAVRELKELARSNDAHVLLLSQLNRSVEGRADKRPLLSDLRDSGEIEQSADNVWLLFRPRYYDRKLYVDENGYEKVELMVAKHRNGPTGLVRTLRVDLARQRWESDYVGVL